MEWNRTRSHDCSELFWLHQVGAAPFTVLKYLEHQGRSKLDNWGGGGGLIFIYLCSAQLISFEIDCFYGV